MQIIRNSEGVDSAYIEDNKLFLNSGKQLGEVVGNKVYSMTNIFLGKLQNDMILVLVTLASQTPSIEKLGVVRTQRLPSIKSVKRIIPTGYRSVFG